MFRHFKRKQNERGEGSKERLVSFSAGIKGRGRDQSLQKTEKRGRERRRDGLTRISVQWRQGCVESEPYTQIGVKSDAHTRSGLTRPGFRDSSCPSLCVLRCALTLPILPFFCQLKMAFGHVLSLMMNCKPFLRLPAPVRKWRMANFKEHWEKDGR